MQIVIDGVTLTDEHAASSYGQLVLVDDQGEGYGPGDPAPGNPAVTCAEYVRQVVADADAVERLQAFYGWPTR